MTVTLTITITSTAGTTRTSCDRASTSASDGGRSSVILASPTAALFSASVSSSIVISPLSSKLYIVNRTGHRAHSNVTSHVASQTAHTTSTARAPHTTRHNPSCTKCNLL
jgi:hypothetical protein